MTSVRLEVAEEVSTAEDVAGFVGDVVGCTGGDDGVCAAGDAATVVSTVVTGVEVEVVALLALCASVNDVDSLLLGHHVVGFHDMLLFCSAIDLNTKVGLVLGRTKARDVLEENWLRVS